MKKRLIMCWLVLLTVVYTEGQIIELKKYLTATKTLEFDESKKVVQDLSFPGCTQYIFASYEEVNGLNFETDIKGIKGYKAIFNCKAQNKAGTFTEQRMMAILFFDKTLKKWRVLDIRKPINACDEYQNTKGNPEVANSQYYYRRVSYWAIMCGKIIEAKEAAETSESRAKAINDKEFVNYYSDILKRIR